jgi:hypothetical protein
MDTSGVFTLAVLLLIALVGFVVGVLLVAPYGVVHQTAAGGPPNPVLVGLLSAIAAVVRMIEWGFLGVSLAARCSADTTV